MQARDPVTPALVLHKTTSNRISEVMRRPFEKGDASCCLEPRADFEERHPATQTTGFTKEIGRVERGILLVSPENVSQT